MFISPKRLPGQSTNAVLRYDPIRKIDSDFILRPSRIDHHPYLIPHLVRSSHNSDRLSRFQVLERHHHKNANTVRRQNSREQHLCHSLHQHPTPTPHASPQKHTLIPKRRQQAIFGETLFHRAHNYSRINNIENDQYTGESNSKTKSMIQRTTDPLWIANRVDDTGKETGNTQ